MVKESAEYCLAIASVLLGAEDVLMPEEILLALEQQAKVPQRPELTTGRSALKKSSSSVRIGQFSTTANA